VESDKAPLTDADLDWLEHDPDQRTAVRAAAEIRRLRAENEEIWRANEIQSAREAILRAGTGPSQRILADVHRALRIACEDIGDNAWPDNLHPADVIDKWLARPASGRIDRLHALLHRVLDETSPDELGRCWWCNEDKCPSDCLRVALEAEVKEK
jgi:hypothetical protein